MTFIEAPKSSIALSKRVLPIVHGMVKVLDLCTLEEVSFGVQQTHFPPFLFSHHPLAYTC